MGERKHPEAYTYTGFRPKTCYQCGATDDLVAFHKQQSGKGNRTPCPTHGTNVNKCVGSLDKGETRPRDG